MIKKLLIGVLGVVVFLVAVVAVAAFVAATEFRVERETVINKPQADIYNYTRFLKNQNEWGPWYKKEPSMKQEFRGTDGEVGFISYWKGTNEQVGEGEQEIKHLSPNSRIETQLRFTQPFASTADAYLILDPVNETQTKVRWGFTGSMPRPLNLFMLVMDMDKEVGKDFADGLASLKTIMEAK